MTTVFWIIIAVGLTITSFIQQATIRNLKVVVNLKPKVYYVASNTYDPIELSQDDYAVWLTLSVDQRFFVKQLVTRAAKLNE